MAQAEVLTDAQIDAVYVHFEHDGPIPQGVEMRESFTKTMGRRVVSTGTGTRVRRYGE